MLQTWYSIFIRSRGDTQVRDTAPATPPANRYLICFIVSLSRNEVLSCFVFGEGLSPLDDDLSSDEICDGSATKNTKRTRDYWLHGCNCWHLSDNDNNYKIYMGNHLKESHFLLYCTLLLRHYTRSIGTCSKTYLFYIGHNSDTQLDVISNLQCRCTCRDKCRRGQGRDTSHDPPIWAVIYIFDVLWWRFDHTFLFG